MERFRMQEQRFTALREMLEYGVYHVVQNLKIEGYTSREPLPFSEKKEGDLSALAAGRALGRPV